MALLSSFGKEGIKLHLLYRSVDIEDTSATSKYFSVTEFPKVFTAGKNSFAFNGSNLLQDKSEVLVECIDSSGQSLYLEQAKSKEGQFTDASKFVVSIHIYNEAYNGPAKVILVGTTAKGESVRWIGNLSIDKTLNNTSKVRFNYRPVLEVRPLLYPVVSLDRATVDYPPPPAITRATAYATINSFVSSATLTDIGKNYNSVNIIVDNTGTGGTGCTATAIIAPDKTIQEVVILTGGSGYRTPPLIKIGGDFGQKAFCVASISSVVTSVVLTSAGSGYTIAPDVVFTSNAGHGSGATAVATIAPEGYVTGITLTNGGDGYTLVPTVALTSPTTLPAPNMNYPVGFSASCFTYAGTPSIDANKNTFDQKQLDIDYRLSITSSTFVPLVPSDFGSSTHPVKVFNSQMEGQILTVHALRVKHPHSAADGPTNLTASFVVKKVIDSQTIQLSEPFYYSVGKNKFVANITNGRCFMNYNFVLFNTAQDSSQMFPVSPELSLPVKDSYAEVVYRNLRCFTGFVSRHKLYRKSSFFPGDFQLVSDEILTPPELLLDLITFNKFYDQMGVFYNQPHVNKYWFSETTDFRLVHSTAPINSMRVEMDDFALADGKRGILVKTDTIGGTNDALYRPFKENEYNLLSGSSYNSNFISLKKGVLYVLKTDLSLVKNPDVPANVSFYFTSSISSSRLEKTYTPRFGVKIGEIGTSEAVSTKHFNGSQYLYFTPQDNYFGTVVVVPSQCAPILSNISFKMYGDYGFSADAQDIRIPFSVKTPSEAFSIKSELLDLNSNVVYAKLQTVQTFDPGGESLVGKTDTGVVNSTITINQGSTTIQGQPYFPDMTQCDNTTRLVGWHIPQGDAEDGKLCYTGVSRLYISSSEYIVLNEFKSGVEYSAKAVAVKYDFESGFGRKIYIDQFGTKDTFP